MIIDMVISGLEPSWKAKGYGFRVDDFRLSAVCYADDILLAAHTREQLEAMINDVVAKLKEIGLGVGAEKSHWTSTPPPELEQLNVDECEVTWEDSLTFVGTVLGLTGSAGPAVLYRMA